MRKHWFWAVSLLCASLWLTACGTGPVDTETGNSDGGTVCRGTSGCECSNDSQCNNGLSCQQGKCATRPGDEPSVNEDAGPTDESAQDEAPKDEPPCEAGALACRCLGNGLCNAGLRCDNGICQTCPEGAAGCACKSDNTCNTGLTCENSVCKGCVGQAFCPCHGNNSCDKGNVCEFSSSGSATCQPCKDRADKTGCNCELDTECGGKLLCLNKRCADASAMNQVPKSPRCYSPCEGDIQNSDGTIRTCHPKYGLKEGCDPGQKCVEGSCLTPDDINNLSGSSYPFCLKQADCPDFQACLGGRCYSNCGADSDCQTGFKCDRYVCRRICDLTKSQCTKEESCISNGVGDEEGLCQPIASRNTQVSQISQTLEVFELSNRKLDLTNLEKVGYFAIANQNNFETKMSIVRHSDSLASKAPLSWLKFDLCKTYNNDRTACTAYENKPSNTEPFKFTIPGKSTVFIRVLEAENGPSSANRYDGLLTIKSSETEQVMAVGYRKTGAGRWKGKLYSFGNFDDDNINKFPNSTGARVADFSNAFLRRWLNFKNNNITFDKFRAVLLSMQEGTWNLPKVRSDCRTLFSQQATEDVACYPFASPGRGYEVLSFSVREAPVPTGLSALNFTIDVTDGPSNTWTGKIHTAETLQYPGNPSINIGFKTVPGQATKTEVAALKAVIDIGGRHLTDSKTSCPNSSAMERYAWPWLLLDFVGTSEAITQSLFREQYECRNKLIPTAIPPSATAEQKAAIELANASLSSANPIPNGRTLRRTIELVDGMLYENRYFFAIVRERFVSPFDGVNQNSLLSKDWVRYGYLWLERTDAELTAKDTKGNDPQGSCQSNTDCSTGQTCQGGVCQGASQLHQVTCDPAMVNNAIRIAIQKSSDIEGWTQSQINNLVSVLLTGQTATAASQLAGITGSTSGSYTEYKYNNTTTNKTHYIHYYCEDTRQFNGGPITSQTDCPSGSKVVFFDLPGITESQMRSESCNTSRTCDTRFTQLKSLSGFRENVPYRCKDTQNSFCDGQDRKDLRSDKVFFKPTSGSTYVSPYQPIRDSIRQAFRYRFKFTNRSGGTIGFTPVMCAAGAASQTPYCYDPTNVEVIEKRVNCLEFLYTNNTIRNRMSTTARGDLRTFLQHAFSYSNSKNTTGDILTDFGFETLNAELRVMLGDEAYIKALNNRFDLAGGNLVSFDGDKLEPNGIKLSGVLGHEMYNLYLSVHYYQSVLNRFYAQTPLLTASFASNDTTFITAESVSSYIKKLLLAATRKARSWSQIAQRYHSMNRIDLARHVLERNYVGSYLEMMVLTRLLRSLIAVTDPKQEPQLRSEIDTITLTYNAALLDMQETYEKVSKELDYFGFEPGYIPFPALDSFSTLRGYTNAVTVAINFAKQKLQTAQVKEQIAIQTQRQFDTDAAKFQSELVKIDNTYNEQLIQLCGELKDGNQSVPAIPRYAGLLPKALQVANPCGKVKGSHIYNAYLGLERLALEAQQLEAMYKRAQERITDEETRIQTFCNKQFDLATVTWEYNEDRKDLKFRMSQASIIRSSIMRGSMGLMQIAMGWKCDVILGDAFDTECAFAGISNALKLSILVAQEFATTALNLEKREKEKELIDLQGEVSKFQVKSTCDICPPGGDTSTCTPGVARVISQNYLKRLTIDLERFALRAINMQYAMRLAASNIERMKQRAQRLMQQQNDALTMLTNVQSVANDPNQRIYKNDAIINAEYTFNEALQEAYRATLVYEYYTSQSYKNKNDLYLVRMISYGDKNLEAYMSQLERAFKDFEETQGKPDIRVAKISLRDDILKLNQVDKDGKILSLQQRVDLLRQKLASREYLNKDGYLTFNFTVSVGKDSNVVSPVTHNHKVLYVAADISHTSAGSDDVARVYIKQKGTGVVRASDGSFTYYALPQKTAVVNATLNGDRKPFDPDVYRTFRLQDRPLANTQWVLQFNQATEKSNQDIDLNSISDITVYIYYSDFTSN